MVTVGITGGIGSGKSVVSQIFKTLKIAVYDADTQAKFLMISNEELKVGIVRSFGKESYENGRINRDFLAKKVFSDGNEIQKLNHLVHPVVKKDFEKWTAHQSGNYVIKEAALLIETGSFRDLDYLIVIDAPVDIRMDRVLKRDSFRRKEEVQEILKKQCTDEIRKQAADFVIDNSGAELLIPQVLKIHQAISKG